MDQQQKPRRKRLGLKLMLGFLLVFGGFIYAVTIPSAKSDAIRALKSCNNIEEVKTVYDQYKPELFDNDDFLFEVRTRLSSFNEPDSVVMACQQWLPQPPTNVNIIVVPDLSRRVIDEENNPHQIENDKEILKSIWTSFEKRTSQEMNTQHSLMVTISNPEQAEGKFDRFADHLITDLKDHPNKSNRLYFTNYRKTQFRDYIDSLYACSSLGQSGADYLIFVKQYLGDLLKEATLFERYQNKLIILTDGYIERKGSGPFKDYTQTQFVSRKKTTNLIAEDFIPEITKKGLNLPIASSLDLSSTEIIVCEVNERKKGRDHDFQILKAYWMDWFQRMNAKDFQFVRRNYSIERTCEITDQFIQQ